ncbi:MAG: hypothetical protein IJI14_16110 [Anaerolineaceae bacterium]|nr:hypothetical protein [Anaerolineaceae bacterium]
MQKNFKILSVFIFLFLLIFVSASANSLTQGTWYLTYICENNKCIEAYKSGLQQEIVISETGKIFEKGGLSAFKESEIILDMSGKSDIVSVTRPDGEKETYRFSINTTGNLIFQADSTKIVYSKEKPFIPGLSEIAWDAKEKDYYGKWKLIGMISRSRDADNEVLNSFTSAEEMNLFDNIEIKKNNLLDMSIAGVKFENRPYIIDNERLFSLIGDPDTENSVIVIMNLHTDGYLTVTYNYDISMDLVFERE